MIQLAHHINEKLVTIGHYSTCTPHQREAGYNWVMIQLLSGSEVALSFQQKVSLDLAQSAFPF
jgi:hypothetical protein